MTEYIERDAANEALRECVRVYPTSFYNGIEVARTAIHKLPAAADVVEVVRCKDCAYFAKAKVNQNGFLICPASGMDITEMDYCSYGERKEG